MAGETRYLGINEESSFGADEGAEKYVDYIRAELDVPDNPVLTYPGAAGRSLVKAVVGPYMASGPVEVGVDPTVFPYFLKWGLGAWTTIGDVGAASTTLATAVSAGDTTITVNSEAGFTVGDIVQIGAPDEEECLKIQALDGGAGPTYTWTMAEKAQKAHSSGDDVKEVDVPFTHTFKPMGEGSLPSFGAHIGKRVFEHHFLGTTIGGLRFSAERGFLVVRMDLVAQKDKKGSLASGSKDLPSEYFAWNRSTVTRDSGDITSYVQSFGLDLNNNLREDEAVRFGNRFPQEFTVGGLDVSGNVHLVFRDTEEYGKYWGIGTGPHGDALTEIGLAFKFELGDIPGTSPAVKYSITFDMGTVHYTRVGTPVSGRDRIEQTVNFEATEDSTKKVPIEVVMVNGAYRYPAS